MSTPAPGNFCLSNFERVPDDEPACDVCHDTGIIHVPTWTLGFHLDRLEERPCPAGCEEPKT